MFKSLFTNKVTSYTDVLQEWRGNVIIDDYRLFDKVVIVKPRWYSNQCRAGDEGLITGYSHANIDTDNTSSSKKPVYNVLTKDNQVIQCWEIKRSYGEFQEEFEALEASKAKMQEVERLSKLLAEERDEALRLYEKGKAVVDKNVGEQFGIAR